MKAESLTTKDENNKTIVTEYWKKLSRMTDSVSTIIISNLSPFACSEVLPKNEMELKFKSTVNLFLQYISLHKKNIIIVEDDTLSIEFLSKMVSEENTFCVHLENNNVFIKRMF